MPTVKIVKIDGMGQVLFERSKKAKHLSISVKPFTGVRVAVPYGLPFRKAEEFVYSKRSWIQKHVERMKQYENQAEMESIIAADIDRAKAKKKLINRLRHLANKHGFSFNRVAIRNQKTRWGSCSRNNNISLNMKLVRLPEELMDYVILHELVHTRIKNHSINFWTELNKYVGDGKKLASGLKKFGIGVI
jgi:predicted metal-dependent hydrolase